MTTDTPSASPVRTSGNNADAPTSVAAPREHFASRLGFILISAGCAIGLGNVWRFPYIAGEYGGAAFILMYLIFLVILGLPVMVMEFAVGRASQRSAAQAFDILQPSRRWHWFSRARPSPSSTTSSPERPVCGERRRSLRARRASRTVTRQARSTMSRKSPAKK